MGRTSVSGHQNVECTIIVDVTVSGPPCHFRSGKRCADLRSRLFELAVPKIAKQMRRLRIAHAFLYSLDFVFDVAIGDQDIEPTIVVVIEEEAAEAQRHQSCTTNL